VNRFAKTRRNDFSTNTEINVIVKAKAMLVVGEVDQVATIKMFIDSSIGV